GLALPVLEGCSKGTSGTARSVVGLLDTREAMGARGGLDVSLAGGDYVAEPDNYLAFGLIRRRGAPIAGADALVWLVPSADPQAPVGVQGPFAAPWYSYAKPDPGGPVRGINATEVRFGRPGVWTLVAEATTSNGALLGSAALQVKAKEAADTLIPGERALPSQTPTVADHRGVEPICTRQPPCDMHRVTLADAVAAGKPVAFTVGTPRFCRSRVCGPNLEELIVVSHEVGDRITFVHAEVYRDDQTQTIINQLAAPTFVEWGLQSEPWLFLIDRSGLIVSRFEGPLTAAQIRVATKPLLAGVNG
ncbi:MAG: TlpA family protein disulfide reductase, partial [Actinomycetota bacterium]